MNYSIIGKGGLHDIILDILTKDKYQGFYDDSISDDPKYLGKLDKINGENCLLAIASIKNMYLRANILNKLKDEKLLNINAISCKSNISYNVKIGKGNIILPFVQIGVNTSIGDGNIIFSNSSIEHDCIIGNNVNIAVGVNIAGSVIIEDNVFIGVGANIIDGIIIKRNSVIGAGSTVLKNVEENSIYYGCPAKKIKKNNIYRRCNNDTTFKTIFG
jgi:sugar O-acyltransferase (sialic acid O-acetyltransferase NeuD family)